ncbi:hypothetical protein Mal4_42350 [Maioricimonas rarisocia]|uniref:Uncharacterized protein n=1 Tax=Maioricimonas rarisocia TaxID=2528026 RepID=A0A517ZBL1_9PLAN|nr:hypothetical protein Mal4_42350 [Maioricimonas rarisocia]
MALGAVAGRNFGGPLPNNGVLTFREPTVFAGDQDAGPRSTFPVGVRPTGGDIAVNRELRCEARVASGCGPSSAQTYHTWRAVSDFCNVIGCFATTE